MGGHNNYCNGFGFNQTKKNSIRCEKQLLWILFCKIINQSTLEVQPGKNNDALWRIIFLVDDQGKLKIGIHKECRIRDNVYENLKTSHF